MAYVHQTLYCKGLEGSVGTNDAPKGVYNEQDLKLNLLASDLWRAITNMQKSKIRLDMTALGRDTVILNNEYDIFKIKVTARHDS